MANNKGFVFFYDWKKPLAKIPPKEFKELILAMIEYAESGTMPEEISPKAEIAADFVFSSIKRGTELSKKRSMAGKAGNATRWNDEESSQTIASYRKSSQTIANDSDVIDAESQAIATKQNKINTKQNKDNTILPPNPPQGGQGEGARDELFERFWEEYPKKVKRAEAEEAWKAIAPDEALLERMLSAISTQKADEGWRREGGRYIPLPANWLRNRRWEDVPVVQTTPHAEQSGTFDTDDFFLEALKRTYGEEVPKW